MSKRDYVIIAVIALTAIIMGAGLASSLQPSNLDVKIKQLSDFKDGVDGDHLYILARQWSWGEEIQLKSGVEYTLHLASDDIQHSFHLEKDATGRSIDILVQPGHEYIVKLPKMRAGVFAIGCTEYCGIQHNKMRGTLVVH